MILKKSISLFLIFSFSKVLACPSCAGSLNNSETIFTVYILMGFILFTYIPFFLIYRIVYKNRKGH